MITIRHTSIQSFTDLSEFEKAMNEKGIRKNGSLFYIDNEFGGKHYRTNFALNQMKKGDGFDYDFVMVNGCRVYDQTEEIDALDDALSPDESEALESKVRAWTERPYVKRNELINRLIWIKKHIAASDKEILSVEIEGQIRRYMEKIEALLKAIG